MVEGLRSCIKLYLVMENDVGDTNITCFFLYISFNVVVLASVY